MKVLLYTLSGLLSGLAGLLFAARINSGEPTAGLSYELTAITATILGGTNLFGGRGSVVGTLIGALIMGVLQNGLESARRPAFLPADRHRRGADPRGLARPHQQQRRAGGDEFLELKDVRKTSARSRLARRHVLGRGGQRRRRWSATTAPANRR